MDKRTASRVISVLYDGCNHKGREYILGEVFGDLPRKERMVESTLRVSEIPWLQGMEGKNYHSRFFGITPKGRDKIYSLLESCDLEPTSVVDGDEDEFITEFGITALPRRMLSRIEEGPYYRRGVEGVRLFSEELARTSLERAFGKTKILARIWKENNGIPLSLRPMDMGRIIAYEDGPVQFADRASDMSGEYVAWNAVSSRGDKNPAEPLIGIYENGFLVGAPIRLKNESIEAPRGAIKNTKDSGKIIVLNKYGQMTAFYL